MSWDGNERRKELHVVCKYEEKILQTSENVVEIKGDIKNLNTRINGSLEKMESHIGEGTWYRKLVLGTALSLALSIVGGIITTLTISSRISYEIGQNVKQLTINTARLERMDGELHETSSRMAQSGK